MLIKRNNGNHSMDDPSGSTPGTNGELKIQVGDAAIFRGRWVVVESVYEDGYWVIDQDGEGYDAPPGSFDHVY